MRIKLTQPVAVKGVHVPGVGIPFECPASEAHILLGMNAAVKVEEAAPESEIIRHADPVIETRDPAPAEHPALRKKKKL